MVTINPKPAPKKTTDEASATHNYSWHSHESSEVLGILGVSAETGLSHDEAKHRQQKYGLNLFTEKPQPGIFSHIFTQLKSPLVIVLLFACLATLILGEYIDAGVIAFALSIAVVVGVLQEEKASRAFNKLAHSQTHVATVLRDGARHEVPASKLVPGDIIILEAGIQVPADIRLVDAKNLSINEAALTGEWRAVEKQVEAVAVGTPFAERSSMAWMGTFVAEGQGIGVIVEIGDETAVGELTTSLQEVSEVNTPLQEEITKLSNLMLYIICFLVALLFVIGIYQGQSLHDMTLMAIAVAVASVPEGLPAAVTIVLAVGMEALLKRGGLVRNLLAAETLGSTTYVLTDKTGTLTLGKMALEGVIYDDATNLSPKSWGEDEMVNNMINTSLWAVNAYLDEAENGQEVMRGDPVEQAVFSAGDELGLVENVKNPYNSRVDYLSFTSERRYAAGLVNHKSTYRLCVNGAPEHLLEQATHHHTKDGKRKLDEVDREAYLAAIEEQSRKGKRLIAVSYKDIKVDDIPSDAVENFIKESVFMGVFILSDPVRSGVTLAINGVRQAGAEVVLVTGDNPQTALSIAQKVGIAGAGEIALTGDDIVELSDEELVEVLDTVHVFARVLPKQKMRLAQVLQVRGEVVAMTGDGINDAPALRKAHIGIAIGSGTEVAKESSDLVLVNDSFSIIYAAIEEGRRIIANIRKIVGYLLATSFSEVILIGGALLVGAAPPLLPAQILWANVIEEGLMSVAFAFEPGEKKAMKRTPQDISEEGILSRQMIGFMIMVVSILSILTLSLYFYLSARGIPLEELRSAMFLAISIDSLFIAFSFRSLGTPFWQIPLTTNLIFIISFMISAILLAVVLVVPTFQKILSYTPLPLLDIVLVTVVSIGAFITIEVGKWFFFERES